MLNVHASCGVFRGAFVGLGIGLAAACGPAYAELGDQLFKLLPNDGAVNDIFGHSVAVSDTTAIGGAYNSDDPGGSAYLFDIATGQQLFKLTANEAQDSDKFGKSVGISSTIAIVGAFGHDGNDPNTGAAYLFDTSTGQQVFKLTASDAAQSDQLGTSVAISGTLAIVGAPHWSGGAGAITGAAYLFDTTSGQQLMKLTASDGAHLDKFGRSVAISGGTAIVGAYTHDANFDIFGAAYLFDTAT